MVVPVRTSDFLNVFHLPIARVYSVWVLILPDNPTKQYWYCGFVNTFRPPVQQPISSAVLEEEIYTV